MPKSVALMRRMENLRKTNEPGWKQKIQLTRRKRTTQHLEKTQTINRLMHRKRVITRTTWKERVLVFTQWKGLQQQVRHWHPMHLQCLNRHLHHLLTKLRMSMREMFRQDIRPIHILKQSVTPMQQASTSSVADANSGNSSKESCKTPVAPLNEVVIDIEDDEDVKSEDVRSKNNSSSEVLYSSGADSVTQVASDINGKTLEHDNGDESLLGSDSASPSGKRIYQSSVTQAKMDLMTDSGVKVKSSAVPFPPLPPMPPTQPSPPSTSKRGKRASPIHLFVSPGTG